MSACPCRCRLSFVAPLHQVLQRQPCESTNRLLLFRSQSLTPARFVRCLPRLTETSRATLFTLEPFPYTRPFTKNAFVSNVNWICPLGYESLDPQLLDDLGSLWTTHLDQVLASPPAASRPGLCRVRKAAGICARKPLVVTR